MKIQFRYSSEFVLINKKNPWSHLLIHKSGWTKITLALIGFFPHLPPNPTFSKRSAKNSSPTPSTATTHVCSCMGKPDPAKPTPWWAKIMALCKDPFPSFSPEFTAWKIQNVIFPALISKFIMNKSSIYSISKRIKKWTSDRTPKEESSSKTSSRNPSSTKTDFSNASPQEWKTDMLAKPSWIANPPDLIPSSPLPSLSKVQLMGKKPLRLPSFISLI